MTGPRNAEAGHRPMGYSHFGQIGDIWKHLPLCSFLQNEAPRKYIESNSAYAHYRLDHTPEQQYGVDTFLNRALSSRTLANTPFVNLLRSSSADSGLTRYLGSPGLAMTLMHERVEQYVFFDLDRAALANVDDYAKDLKLSRRVFTRNEDSLEGVHRLLGELSPSDFIHFDPYFAFEKNGNGCDYFDVFLEAIRKKIKGMLWYGYNTLEQQALARQSMNAALDTNGIDRNTYNIRGIEIILSAITSGEPAYNPGIMACGIITGNLSAKSLGEFDALSDALVEIYKGAKMNNGASNGELTKETIF
jgi:23S rRNA (adenine2030-N6)-methyltransferase